MAHQEFLCWLSRNHSQKKNGTNEWTASRSGKKDDVAHQEFLCWLSRNHSEEERDERMDGVQFIARGVAPQERSSGPRRPVPGARDAITACAWMEVVEE